jgi:L-cystine uptake protein TcyP (sodium:dicarboxylate symporter family)
VVALAALMVKVFELPAFEVLCTGISSRELPSNRNASSRPSTAVRRFGMVLGFGVGALLGPDIAILSPQAAEVDGAWLALPGQIFLGLIAMVLVPLIQKGASELRPS